MRLELVTKRKESGKKIRLKKIVIQKYGPFSSFHCNFTPCFNLIYEPNEKGKTFLVEAILRMLFKIGRKKFRGVKEEPTGELTFEYGEKTYTFQRGKCTTESVPFYGKNFQEVTGISFEELENILVVRDTNLTIDTSEKGGSSFSSTLTEKLTGAKVEKVGKVIEEIKEIGKITPKKREMKEELKKKMDKALLLIKEIETQLKEGRFEELEVEKIQLKEEVEKIRNKKNRIKEIQNRIKYEEGKRNVEKLKEEEKKLRKLGKYDEKIRRELEELIIKRGEGKRKKREKKESLEEEVKLLTKKEKEKNELLSQVSKLGKLNSLIPELRDKLKNYYEEVKLYKKEEPKLKLGEKLLFLGVKFLSLPLVLLFLISLYGVLTQRLPWKWGSSTLGISILLIVWMVWWWRFVGKVVKRVGEMKVKEEELKREGQKLTNEEIESLSEMVKIIEEIQGEYEIKKGQLREIEGEIKTTKERKQKLEKEVVEIERDIIEVERKLTEKIGKSEEVEDYIKKCKEKEETQKTILECNKELSMLFFNTSQINLSTGEWEVKVKELEGYKGEEEGRELKDLEKELKELEIKEEKLKDEIRKIEEEERGMVQKIRDWKVQGVSILDFNLKESLTSLKEFKQRLEKFVYENEKRKERARKVVEMLEEIKKEEREKLGELFEKESKVNEHFTRITQGKYLRVIFHEKELKMEVEDRFGTLFTPEQLSGGAYDQLYFSIRLALGEMIFKGGGFFILDDPFIKSDKQRLEVQVELLKEIVRLGWQVIYLTAKEEVYERLKGEEMVKIIEL